MEDAGEHGDEAGDEHAGRQSRRSFLRASGIGAAGIAAGAIGAAAVTRGFQGHGDPDATYGFTPLPARREPGFDHVVVLMFENRSFDHVLGRLYTADSVPNGQTFEGLQNGDHSNAAPDGTVVPAHVYEGTTDQIMSQPDPDPGEFYSHVNTQLFDVVDPDTNADLAAHDLAAPWNAPRDKREATMSGFVRDYIINFRLERGKDPTPEEYAAVMGGFAPEMLPVISALARGFAVYDHWHCAVPSQTFCNRSFFHASTSHGFVTNVHNGGQSKWLDAPAVPTIFNRLEDAGKIWRVYYDADQGASLTGMLHAPSIEKYWKTNFRSMEQFHDDARTGHLPDYAFIEPRMVFDHNDMHPPVSRPKVVHESDGATYDSALSDIRAAEALLAEVYSSVRGASTSDGSNAMNTMLLVTFDEHGGIYDHVAPPAATPPTKPAEPGEMGFTFDRLGARVPAIVISAHTAAGTVINDEMHHGSVVKTLCEQHGLSPLTRRDADAPSMRNAVTLKTPRQPALWPDVHSPYVPKNPEARRAKPTDAAHRDRPLTAPALGLIGLLLEKYEPGAELPRTYGDAYAVLQKHGQDLFGVRD
ncbi:alkaline phosphatase family protein [Microbacterium murale]|uniref:phospholipase C n=1 Tax=Microbacterium murale TaxID=1081040 RepID=A0ABQ1REP2_9MICO|nr:alkaline phosphatase family protein [Microbacterium murale]GGD68054.1 phosphoesterase [Microbacterium murale]